MTRLSHNKTLYDKGEKFMSGKSFSVWINNEYIPNNPDKGWIKEVSSKSVKKSIEDGYLSEEDGHYNFSLEYIYPKLKDEEMAKESVQELINMSKENNLEFNDQNYAVIDGVKTGW